MRIAYLTSDFGVPVLGRKGASVHVRRMVRALRRRGHEILVLTPSLGGDASASPDLHIAHLPFEGIPDELYESLKREEACAGPRVVGDQA